MNIELLLIFRIFSFFLFYVLFLYGWGTIVIKALRIHQPCEPFYTAAHGLGLIIFIGGILNFLGLAVPIALRTLIILGIFFSLIHAIQCYLKIKPKDILYFKSKVKAIRINIIPIIFFLLALGIFIFLVLNLTPSSAYNIGDDLKKYLPRTIQMLQTGSLGKDYFNSNGLEVLGAQEFLHGFILIFFPFEYVDMFDSIFCFIFSSFLFFEFFRRYLFKNSFLFAFILLIIIHPQKVNISSLYSGTLFIICLIFALSNENSLNAVIPASMFSASLFVLKNTYIPFLLLFIFIYFIILFSKQEKKLRLIKVFIVFIGINVLFISPWILIYFSNYVRGYFDIHYAQAGFEISQLFFGGSLQAALKNALLLFSNTKHHYGGLNLCYTGLVLLMLSFILFNIFNGMGKKNEKLYDVIHSVGFACIIYYFILPLFLTLAQAIRFSIPVLCGIFPVITCIFFYESINHFFKTNNLKKFMFPFIAGGVILFIGISFLDVLAVRYRKILEYNTNLSFPDNIMLYQKKSTQFLLSQKLKKYTFAIQSKTKKDSKIFAWVSTPFYLNFQRNQIVLAGDLVGMTTPWLNFPFKSDAQKLKKFLVQHHIRYVYWEKKSPFMPTLDDYYLFTLSPLRQYRHLGNLGINLQLNMLKLMKDSHIIYNTDRMTLFQLR